MLDGAGGLRALGEKSFHVRTTAPEDSVAIYLHFERISFPAWLALERNRVKVTGNYQPIGTGRSHPCDQICLRRS